MSLLAAAGAIWLVSAAGMTLLWAWSRHSRHLAYVDVGWAAMMTASALFVGLVGEGSPLVRLFVALFGSVWGARLSLHLLSRRLSEHDDGRYRMLAREWGGRPHLLFVFFQLQAVMVMLFSLPMLAAAANPAIHVDAWMFGAMAVWAVAVFGEMIADRQLARFRIDPSHRGLTCRTGLWAWSRHPNYFFEWLHWFVYVLLAIGGPQGWLALTGPVLMFAFLVRVSGIPWTEAQALRSRGDDYRRYQRDVNAFFPGPPRPTR